MTQKPDNPQAFAYGGKNSNQVGMTLRDYFAAAALQGVLARPNTPAQYDLKSEVAAQCYDYADAMLKSREAIHD